MIKNMMVVLKLKLAWIFIIFTIGLIMLQTTNLQAANVPGTIEGSFQNVKGTANYAIPIPVPKGRNGMAPKLSLSYNSQNADGQVGVGWRLDGVLMITRGVHLSERTQDFNNKTSISYNDTDQLKFNGRELKKINQIQHMGEGAVYMTDIDSGMQLVYTNDIFKAKTKEGSILEFGHQWSVNGAVVGWVISSIYDSYGNSINYNYMDDTDVPYIESISYTDHSTENKFTGSYVYFTYNTYSSLSHTVVNGTTLSNTLLLDTIRTVPLKIFPDPFPEFEWQKYQLTYEDARVGSGVKRLKSIKVTEKRNGLNNTLPATNFTYNDDLADTSGDFIQRYWGFDTGKTLADASEDEADANQYVYGDFDGDGRIDIISISKKRPASGDPKYYHYAKVFLTNKFYELREFTSTDLSVWQDRDGDARHFFHAVDLDEDGISELVEVYLGAGQLSNHEIRIQYWKLDTDSEDKLVLYRSTKRLLTTSYPMFTSGWKTSWRSAITDWNGDGRSDLVIYGGMGREGSGTGLWVSPHLNQGDGSFQENVAIDDTPYADVDTYELEDPLCGQFFFVDVTDDGKPDVLHIYRSHDGVYAHMRVLKNTGYGIELLEEHGAQLGAYYISSRYNGTYQGEDVTMAYYKFADMNMDGRLDLISVNRDWSAGTVETRFFWNKGNGIFHTKWDLSITTMEDLFIPDDSCIHSRGITGLPEGTPYHVIADYDNDGYPDVLVYRNLCTETGSSYEASAGVHIFKNNAGIVESTSSFVQTLGESGPFLRVDPWDRNPPILALAWDDDSAVDILERYEEDGKIKARIWTRQDIQRTDLLTTITNGHGVTTSIEYASPGNKLGANNVHDHNFYTPSSNNNNLDDQFDLSPGYYLVRRHTVTQSNGDVVEDATYRYEANQHHLKYGSLGFEYIYSYNELTDQVGKVGFYQDFPKIGIKKFTGYYSDDTEQNGYENEDTYSVQNYPGTTDVVGIYPYITESYQVKGGNRVGGPTDRKTKYDFDLRGRLEKKIESFGGGTSGLRHLTTAYTYSDNSPDNINNISATDLDTFHLGFYDTLTSFESDANGTLKTGDVPRKSSYTYTDELKIETVTVHLEDAADDITVSYEYDSYGNITKETDGQGNAWSTDYWGPSNWIKTKTNPLGHTKKFDNYDYFTWQALKITDENNIIHNSDGGAFGRHSIRKAPGSSAISHKTSYSSAINVPNPDGLPELYDKQWTNVQTEHVRSTWDNDTLVRIGLRAHDDMGRLITEANLNTPYHEITYGAHGKPETDQVVKPNMLESSELGDFSTNKYEYDEWLRQDKHIRDDVTLSEIVRAYDGTGTETYQYPSASDDQTASTVIVTNVFGKVAKRTLPSGDVTQYAYNIYGQLIAVTDPTSQISTYTFDKAGRLKEQHSGETGTISYTYDKRSLPKTRTNADGKSIEMEYDALGRLTHRYTKGHDTQTWFLKEMVYDNPLYSNSIGRLSDVYMKKSTTGKDENANWQILAEYSYNYDKNGHVSTQTRKVLNNGNYDIYTFHATYHPDGQPDTITYPDGSKVRYTINTEIQSAYADASKAPRVSKIEYAQDGSNFVTVKEYTWYDYHGHMMNSKITPNLQNPDITLFDMQVFDKNGIIKSRWMSDADQNVGFYNVVSNRSELGFLKQAHFSRYLDGNIETSITDYDYTDEGMLVSATNNDPDSYGSESYTYLSDGRRETDQTYNYSWRWRQGKAHQLLIIADSDQVMDDEQIGQIYHLYDDNGAMNERWIGKWKAADNSMFPFQRQQFTYDAENMLETEIITYSNKEKWSGSYEDRNMSFYYDHVGQRFYKKTTAGSTTTETFYITPTFIAEKTTIGNSSVMEYTKYIMGDEGLIASLKTSDLSGGAGAMAPMVPFNSQWMAADMYRWDHPVSAIKKIIAFTHALIIHPKTVQWAYLIVKIFPSAIVLAILISLLFSSRGWVDRNSFRYQYPILARVTWAVLFFFVLELVPTLPKEAFAATTGGSEAYQTYHRDLTGNVVMTIDASSTDPQGYVESSFTAYKPFGGVDFGASSNTENSRYNFSGKEIDFLNSSAKDQGLSYFGARYYDSISGRFLTPDPKSQYTDPYMYAWNSPVNGVDPDGQSLILLGLFALMMLTALTVSYIVYVKAKNAGEDKIAANALLAMKIIGGAAIIICGIGLGIGTSFALAWITFQLAPAAAAGGVAISAGAVGLGVSTIIAGVVTRWVWQEERAGNIMMWTGTGLAMAGLCAMSAYITPLVAEPTAASVVSDLFCYSVTWYFGGGGGGGSWNPGDWDYDYGGNVWAYSFAQLGLDLGVGLIRGPVSGKLDELHKAKRLTEKEVIAYSSLTSGLNGMSQNLLWAGIANDKNKEQWSTDAIVTGFGLGMVLGMAGYGLTKGLKAGTMNFRSDSLQDAVITAGATSYGIGGVFARVSARDAITRGSATYWAVGY